MGGIPYQSTVSDLALDANALSFEWRLREVEWRLREVERRLREVERRLREVESVS